MIKNIQWQYFSYILYKFEENQFRNSKDYKGNNYRFSDNTAKMLISTNYLRKYWADLQQIFSDSKHTWWDNETHFVLT